MVSLTDKIKVFLAVPDSDGSGDGSGSGSGSGYGYGSGDGSGSGSGSGYGYGSGAGSGSGSGSGDGSGSGSGDGSGAGSGSGSGIRSYNGAGVHLIDDVPTIITDVPRDNVAVGGILQTDLTLTPCYVVKEDGKFAHGETLREAFAALQEKLWDTDTEYERLARFREHFPDMGRKYPAADLFIWHHVLTGSCKAGREAFCRDKDIDVERDTFTISEFVELTRDAYGGETVAKLIDIYTTN